MLLALRKIVEPICRLPSASASTGARFSPATSDPFYRRTYTVMGDAVNLAARLMAKAEPGQIYATADVLDRSNTIFENTELAPFAVKGKAQPVQAWSVGRADGFAHAARIAAAAAVDRPRCRTRADPRGARERARRAPGA